MARPFDLTDPKEVTERLAKARAGAKVGAKVGGLLPHPAGRVVGATLGGISGFILGDQETVFPIDMIAVPAFEYYGMVANGGHTPTFMIYIKEGEVLTQVQQTDAQEALEVLEESPQPKKKQRLSKWNRYVKKKSNHIRFKSGKNKGKLDLKKMAKVGGFGKKKGGRK